MDAASDITNGGPGRSGNGTTCVTPMVDREETDKGGKCCRRLKCPPFRVIITVLACFFVQLVLGISYTTGNVLPYVTSYLRNVTGETSLDYSSALWIDNTTWIVVYLILPFVGLLDRRVSHRLLLFVGVAANAISFFGTYWALQASFALTVVIRGAFHGIGQAILWPLPVNLAIGWFPKRKGSAGACVIMGFGGGAFVWNQIVTSWINPHNLQPDLTVNDEMYFTQREVLDNVPTCHLLLGGILTGILLVCVASMAYPPTADKNEARGNTLVVEVEKPEKEDSADDVTKAPFQNSSYSSNDNDDRDVGISFISQDQHKPADKASPDYIPDYTPLEVIQSRGAWTVWFINIGMGFGITFIWAFYKAYGQTFIHDDHLLALIGSFSSVFNCIGRPIWGLLADKIGIQTCLMVSQSALLVSMATLVVCEHAGAAMFFVWVCLIFFAFSGYYTVEIPLVFTMFGARCSTFSIGFVYCSGVIYMFCTTFVAAAAKDAFGWRGVFLVGAGFIFFGLLCNASMRLDCGHPIPAHMKRDLFSGTRTRTRRP
ncbi:hypothetical protein BaRGS_00001857 [Batillaria attramentaria]|uniref:Major facilitator superfamily (MFS) profile domain-containing protein n=1 Tax=Batillaria attramentaria TaxID=370345 RepID=A0ABD0M6F0_9CAEN